MRAGLCIAMLAACYSAKPQQGLPCTPSIENCPTGQFCALLDGESVCVTELPGLDANEEVFADASIDAPIDAPIVPDGSVPKVWTLVRSNGSTGTGVSFPASTAGNTIIVGIETSDNDPVDTLTDTANNTYTRALGSRGINDGEDFGIEIWYAKNVLAGATRVTATGDTVYAITMWEVAGLDKTSPLTATSKLDDRPESTSPVGAPITTTTAGEFVVSIAIVANQVSGIKAGNAFTNDETTFGNGWAHLTSKTAAVGTYQAQWDQPTIGASCAASAAFKLAP